jgi:hypothetical protein
MSLMKVYHGDANTNQVIVDGRPLAMRREVRDYSQMFGWGHGGRETSQLALAILCDHMHDVNRALRYVIEFKWDVLVNQCRRGSSWTLTTADIETAIKNIDRRIAREVKMAQE